MFGTFPILRPIFHVMKNVGRVILEECKGAGKNLQSNFLGSPLGELSSVSETKGGFSKLFISL